MPDTITLTSHFATAIPGLFYDNFAKFAVINGFVQWRRAIEALEAHCPPDSVATLVDSYRTQ